MKTKSILVVVDGTAVNAIEVSNAAIVSADGTRVEWEGEGLDAPEGSTFRDQPGAAIGWTMQGGALVAPPLLPEPPPTVPASVSRAQAKIALHRAGKLVAVKAAVAAADDEEIGIWFDEASTWERANPYVVMLGGGLGLSAEQIDDLFREAAQIAT